ncbi:hypothetical protein F5144DRAFT_616539 [Chaetomium tenue]|uniref:Uncharacterized protein n=1 Tax=Chaetomium tenue TaxID=1854479 RepID=A0ACB7PM29_9PEZI|nr:hypothetical protein F5144DRAFT_616539 [Chaetomium globosum]
MPHTKDHNNQVNQQRPTQPHQTPPRSPRQNMDSTTPTPTTTTGSGSKTTHFSLFSSLPFELRKLIWTTALLAPLTPSRNNNTPDTWRPLHIRLYRIREPGDLNKNPGDLESKDGPDQANEPPVPPLIPDQTAENAKSVALDRAARFSILATPRHTAIAKTNLYLPGTPMALAAYDSGWLAKDEVYRIASSCQEARQAFTDLKRWLGPPERWVDLRDGVCCFWGYGRYSPGVTEDEHQHPVLVPGLELEDALMLEDGGPAKGALGKKGMVRGDRGLIPAMAHCEELAVMWDSRYCKNLFAERENHDTNADNTNTNTNDREKPPTPCCAVFKKHLVDVVTRHPKLHTLYLLDADLAPAEPHVPAGSVPKFREQDVFRWADLLEKQLSSIRKEVGVEGHIQVKILACVLDSGAHSSVKDCYDCERGLEAIGLGSWISLVTLPLHWASRQFAEAQHDCHAHTAFNPLAMSSRSSFSFFKALPQDVQETIWERAIFTEPSMETLGMMLDPDEEGYESYMMPAMVMDRRYRPPVDFDEFKQRRLFCSSIYWQIQNIASVSDLLVQGAKLRELFERQTEPGYTIPTFKFLACVPHPELRVPVLASGDGPAREGKKAEEGEEWA